MAPEALDDSTRASDIAITGAHGFLGWHTRAALLESGTRSIDVKLGDGFDSDRAQQAITGKSRLIHLAGVNRGNESQVMQGNILFANQVADTLRRSEAPPSVVVYSNSVQAGNGTAYGEAKIKAADILAHAASDVGVDFVDLRLPNLFGENGRPFYNAVTATFCHVLAEGGNPAIEQDRELTLLHAQNAADLLTGVVDPDQQSALEVKESVSGLLTRLSRFSTTYLRGEIPDISSCFDRDLFNTYRSYTFKSQTPIALTRHADDRGSFFEVIRTHGGTGQSSFSTTAPGVTRGNHYHRRKIERFTVLAGEARIALRKLFTDEVYEFSVSGREPMAIDMPTMWSHNIENSGTEDLYTIFWTNDLFDQLAPDTIAEVV